MSKFPFKGSDPLQARLHAMEFYAPSKHSYGIIPSLRWKLHQFMRSGAQIEQVERNYHKYDQHVGPDDYQRVTQDSSILAIEVSADGTLVMRKLDSKPLIRHRTNLRYAPLLFKALELASVGDPLFEVYYAQAREAHYRIFECDFNERSPSKLALLANQITFNFQKAVGQPSTEISELMQGVAGVYSAISTQVMAITESGPAQVNYFSMNVLLEERFGPEPGRNLNCAYIAVAQNLETGKTTVARAAAGIPFAIISFNDPEGNIWRKIALGALAYIPGVPAEFIQASGVSTSDGFVVGWSNLLSKLIREHLPKPGPRVYQ